MPIYDISLPISKSMVVWPGDAAVHIFQTSHLDRGDTATVSRLEMGAHTGTHVDAPAHFIQDGAAVHTLDLGTLVGPGDTAKRIDVLSAALTFGATVDDLANSDLAYAPPYNSAMDPLHHAANIIRNKQSGYARTLTPQEVKSKIDNGDNFILLDVRSPGEWDAYRIEARQTKLLPLTELRHRLGELSKDEEIVIYCLTSVRAYQAQRILDGAGFRNVKFMDGSIAAWPYDIYNPHPDK